MSSNTQIPSPFGVLNPVNKVPFSFVSLNIPVEESEVKAAVDDGSSNRS